MIKVYDMSKLAVLYPTFWEIESKVWKHLYQKQRGGRAFNSIQRDLADARALISELESALRIAEMRD
jgi:hypothetical protein